MFQPHITRFRRFRNRATWWTGHRQYPWCWAPNSKRDPTESLSLPYARSIPAVITHEFGWSRFDPFTDSGTTTGNFQVNGSSGCLHLLWRWVVVSFYSGFPAAPISPRLNNESQRLWVLSKQVTMTTTYGLILWNWFSTMILSWIMVIHWMEWSKYEYIISIICMQRLSKPHGKVIWISPPSHHITSQHGLYTCNPVSKDKRSINQSQRIFLRKFGQKNVVELFFSS